MSVVSTEILRRHLFVNTERNIVTDNGTDTLCDACMWDGALRTRRVSDLSVTTCIVHIVLHYHVSNDLGRHCSSISCNPLQPNAVNGLYLALLSELTDQRHQ